ncbi:MAG: hypothetical protein AB9846_07800 [Tenuifilaceae bacterium]
MILKWLKENQMGFAQIQSGIMRRFLREEGAWTSHLNNSRNYILETVRETKPKSIRILGSGWLLDIPIKELNELCEKIVLDDIMHPAQIVNKYSRFDKIKFEYNDITNGVVDLCYNQKRKNFQFDSFIDQIIAISLKNYSEDLIISANLLSQPSIMFTDYLAKKVKLSNSQIISITEIIQQKIIDALPKGRSILISDLEEEYYDEDDKLLGSKPTVFINFPVNSTSKEWSWDFDSKMFYKADCKTKLKVAAVRI